MKTIKTKEITTFYTENEENSFLFGKKLASKLTKGTLILLDGDLGAGKTIIAAGIATGLGVSREKISSPTYMVMNAYNDGLFPVYHWDFYRIVEEEELEMADFFEILHEADGIVIIEWASMFSSAWKKYAPRIEIKVEHGEETNSRKITVTTIKI